MTGIRFSTKELRLITGIPAKNINTYKLREKLYRDEDGMWPYDNELNKSFIEQRGLPGQLEAVLGRQKLSGKNDTRKFKAKPKDRKTSRPKKEAKEEKEKPEEMSELSKVALEQKKLSIQKARAEYELKEIELQQKRGSVLPKDQTLLITKTYSENLNRNLNMNIGTFVQDICVRHSLDNGKAGEYKMKVTKLINKSIKEAVSELLKNFE